MDEVVKEFLIESHENLNQLDHDLIELEKDPHSKDLLGSVFRTIHSIKGVSGFLDFPKLELLTHAAEELLSKLRDGELVLNQAITSVLLATVDAVRQMLAKIEADGNDGDQEYPELVSRLAELCGQESSAAAPSSADSTPPAPIVEETIAEEPETASAQPEAVAEPVVETKKKSKASRKTKAPRPAAPEQAPVAQVAEELKPAPLAAAVASNPPAPRPEDHPREEAHEAAASAAADSSIRVNVNLLDKVMNLVGELVLVRNQILQFSMRQQESSFLSTSQRLNLITSELQEGIMKTRMQPIGNIWNKFPRIARDLALACGKQVRIEMEGEETELDKTLIEAIRDPLTHIVRNSIDHGIELPPQRLAAGKPAEGRLFLRALHESGQVIIEVADDGAGIDIERVRAKALERGLITPDQAAHMSESETLKLVFLPGFSTAQKVTNISGRGVGMDVVKTNIEKIGGTVDMQSVHGQGARLRIKIPLTLAIIPALIVTCAGDRYAIPQISLIELVRLEAEEKAHKIELIHGAPVYRLRGNLLPLVYLHEVLKVSAPPSDGDAAAPRASHIVVLQVADQQFGLVVDQVSDTEEIVVKPLGKQFKGVSAFAGATIMGDGRVALILDVPGAAQLSGVLNFHDGTHAEKQDSATHARSKHQRLLLCRAGSSERIAVPLALVSRLEEFTQAQIEHAAGCRVVRYRGQILPLVDLASLLGSGCGDEARDPLPVVVFDDGRHHRVGVVVDQIIDIVEEETSATQLSSRSGLLGSAVVNDKATDFLDLRAVFEAARQSWYDGEPAEEISNGSILLIDQSGFSRGLVRSYLEMAGHNVIEANGAAEALEKLDCNHFNLAIVSANLPGNGAVLEQIRKRTNEAHIPVMGLADDRGETSPAAAAKYDSYHFKSERQAILDAVSRLISGETHEDHHETHSMSDDLHLN
jgi:two-component system chemotaxis sensor kinase CheA